MKTSDSRSANLPPTHCNQEKKKKGIKTDQIYVNRKNLQKSSLPNRGDFYMPLEQERERVGYRGEEEFISHPCPGDIRDYIFGSGDLSVREVESRNHSNRRGE